MMKIHVGRCQRHTFMTTRWHPSLFFYACVFSRSPWRWQSLVASLGDPCLSWTSLQHLPLLVFESSSLLSQPILQLSSPHSLFIYFCFTIRHFSLSHLVCSHHSAFFSVSPSHTLSLSLHLCCIHITMETRQLRLLPAPSSRFHSIRIRGQRLEPQTGLHQFFFFFLSIQEKKDSLSSASLFTLSH